MKIIGGLFVIASIVIVSSCTTQLETYVAHPPIEGWRAGESVEVEVENYDTLARSELSIFVRYHDARLRDTLHLDITTTAPDSTSYSEPFTIAPPIELERSKLHEVSYRTAVRWRQMGHYRVSFTPRRDIVGVESIGFKKHDLETF
ncbi:MAG: hypothetical protein SNH63_06255 [Rikenellaceae bacterium]